MILNREERARKRHFRGARLRTHISKIYRLKPHAPCGYFLSARASDSKKDLSPQILIFRRTLLIPTLHRTRTSLAVAVFPMTIGLGELGLCHISYPLHFFTFLAWWSTSVARAIGAFSHITV
jgi:hypothetical protein